MLAPAIDAQQPVLHDITIEITKTHECARVAPVPPEDFGISRYATCVRDANYCFDQARRTQADLIAEGYDPAQVKTLPSYAPVETAEHIARDTVEENLFAGSDEGMNKANRLILVTEHYIRMDYEGDGKARLYRVTTAGDQCVILRRKEDDGGYQDDIVEVDCAPFAAMTPVIMTHRFFGRSIADLVMDIQRIKTALLRGMLDNLYLHNNPRVEVSETHASDNTIPDLLVSRPLGIVRTRAPGGLNYQVVPDITGSVYPALQYFDATREWRTGVSRQGQGVDPNALQNQVATIANQMFTASQAKIKLIARIFAETGIRDLFSLLHGVIRKNGSQAQTVRLRNKWVNVDPRQWKERNDLTINVGLGTGTKDQQLVHMMTVLTLQKEAIAGGMTHMVTPDNLYNSAKEVVKLVGLKNVDRFFANPQGKEPPPPPPDPKMLELQAKNEIEKTQAAADIETQRDKTQAEIAMAERKFELDRDLAMLNANLQRELKLLEAQLRMQESGRKMAEQSHMMAMKEQAQNGEGRSSTA